MIHDDDHGHLVTDLGAYVLGALDPPERHRVEAHLEVCQTCRDELARLSGLPALLDRLTLEEATASLADAPAAIATGLGDRAVASVVELRASVRRWRLGSVAAALVAVVAVGSQLTWLVEDDGPTSVEAELIAVAPDAGPVEGSAAAYAWDWGTTIRLDVTGLPDRERYVIWVIDTGGEAQLAGTWGPTPDRSANVRSATALSRARIATIEVRDDDDDVLLTADLPVDVG